METKTKVGKILQQLDYRDSQVERFDNLAMHLYSIPMNERDELLSALMWYCDVMKDDGTIRENYKWHIKYYNELLAKINK